MKAARPSPSASLTPPCGGGAPTDCRPLPRRSRSTATSGLPRSPSRPSSSSVPFSWEQRPGIPKASNNSEPRPPDPLLPLPPPLKAGTDAPRKKRSKAHLTAAAAADPFAAAIDECTKGRPRPPEGNAGGRGGGATTGRRKAATAGWTVGDRLAGLGILGLVGSCKAACSVAESTVSIPRSGLRAGAYRLLSRRPAA